MATKTSKNTVETRLEDAKKQYIENAKVIKELKKFIDRCESLSVTASNGTSSMIPEFKSWQELVKLNITLRKQINDMEQIIQNGKIKTEEDANPFE